ncbi:MAG: transposase [Paludibacteraceae bacterium]
MKKAQGILQENARLKELLKVKDEQLARKNERILYLERQLFGRRSEKSLPTYPDAQLSLFDTEQGSAVLEQEASVFSTLAEEIKQKAEQRVNAKKSNAVSQKRPYKIPADIERRERIIHPDGIDLEDVIKIGEDVSERLMIEPSRFWVERIVRPVYKKMQEQQAVSTMIIQAPPHPTILPGCMAGESLLSQIIIDKFLYHLPEYRQAKRFKDFGVELGTSSINRWVHDVADKLYPLYLAQTNRVLATDYIQVDETSHSITDRSGSARKGYIWVVRSVLTPGVFFHYDKGSRSQDVVLKCSKTTRGHFKPMVMPLTVFTKKNRVCCL